jgi:hypothetical protein
MQQANDPNACPSMFPQLLDLERESNGCLICDPSDHSQLFFFEGDARSHLLPDSGRHDGHGCCHHLLHVPAPGSNDGSQTRVNWPG